VFQVGCNLCSNFGENFLLGVFIKIYKLPVWFKREKNIYYFKAVKTLFIMMPCDSLRCLAKEKNMMEHICKKKKVV